MRSVQASETTRPHVRKQFNVSNVKKVNKWLNNMMHDIDKQIEQRNRVLTRNIGKNEIYKDNKKKEKEPDSKEQNQATSYVKKGKESEMNEVNSNGHGHPKQEEEPESRELYAKTSLHQKHIMDWLSRYKGKVKIDYLLLPAEKQKRKEFKQIFIEFDEDKSMSLEVSEFLEMLMTNYIATNHDFVKKMKQDSQEATYIKDIQSIIEKELKLIYSYVSNNDSLSLEQFVSMCVSPQCNTLLSGLINTLRVKRNDMATRWIADKIGFSKNLPFNFEDMVKKLVYKKDMQDLRVKLEKVKNVDMTKRMELLNEMYKVCTQNCEDCVSKFETIYQLNKRNISGAETFSGKENSLATDDHQNKFYDDFFKRQREEAELGSTTSLLDLMRQSDKLKYSPSQMSVLPSPRSPQEASQQASHYPVLSVYEAPMEVAKLNMIKKTVDQRLKHQAETGKLQALNELSHSSSKRGVRISSYKAKRTDGSRIGSPQPDTFGIAIHGFGSSNTKSGALVPKLTLNSEASLRKPLSGRPQSRPEIGRFRS